MDAIRRTLPLRRVATTASLAALLLVPAHADAKAKKKAKSPVITAVTPMRATVGQTLTIKGQNFRKGKGRNSVGFQRDGKPVVFIKADVSTTRVMYVKLSSKLEKVLTGSAATFHLRVLSSVFGKQYTSKKLSPVISPAPKPAAADATPTPTASASDTSTPASSDTPAPACTPTHSDSVDTDGDLLSDALEDTIGTDPCKADTDGDGVSDGFEYKSAVDLNDDEYQSPNVSVPYPGARPYPNPLDPNDAATDYDGDGLTMQQEYKLNQYAVTKEGKPNTLFPLQYSDGLQYSVYETCPSATNPSACNGNNTGKRVPALNVANYDREVATGGATTCATTGIQTGFIAWANLCGYGTTTLRDEPWSRVGAGPAFSAGDNNYPLLDANRDGSVSTAEQQEYELSYFGRGLGWLSDDERDEDADGLSNWAEFNGPMSGQAWWTGCYSNEKAYPVDYAGTDATNPDSDGDGIRDGADDQDHDDVPNVLELSRFAATGVFQDPYCDSTKATHPYADDAFGRVNPFNPCLPDFDSRTCNRYQQFGQTFAPDDGSKFFVLN